jgi:hypothetical protein
MYLKLVESNQSGASIVWQNPLEPNRPRTLRRSGGISSAGHRVGMVSNRLVPAGLLARI